MLRAFFQMRHKSVATERYVGHVWVEKNGKKKKKMSGLVKSQMYVTTARYVLDGCHEKAISSNLRPIELAPEDMSLNHTP